MDIRSQILDLVESENPDNPIEYVNSIVRDLSIKKLNQHMLNCRECSICECNKKSYPCGNSNALIMVVLDQCGDDGISNPLETNAGKALLEELNKLGIYKDDLFVINAINCFPHRSNGEKRPPTKKERTNCRHFLDYAIKTIDPLMIFALGGIAVNTINEEIGKSNIKNIRGQWFYYKGIPVMPTFHPAFFDEAKEWGGEELSSSFEEQYKGDLKEGVNWVKESYSDLFN